MVEELAHEAAIATSELVPVVERAAPQGPAADVPAGAPLAILPR
jgi:hypothetical protein